MPNNAAIIAKAREAIGTPWVHTGRTLRGLDCIGLVLWDFRQLGITEYEPPPYPREADWSQFVGYFRANMEEVKLLEAVPGNVLVVRQKMFPCHCGFLASNSDGPTFIHAYAKRKKVVEERYTDAWKKDSVAAFKVPGLEN